MDRRVIISTEGETLGVGGKREGVGGGKGLAAHHLTPIHVPAHTGRRAFVSGGVRRGELAGALREPVEEGKPLGGGIFY